MGLEKKNSRLKREREARRMTLQGRVGHAKETGRFFDRQPIIQIAYEVFLFGDLLQEKFDENSFEHFQGGFLRCFAALLGLLVGKVRRLTAALLIGYALLLGLLLLLIFRTLAV